MNIKFLKITGIALIIGIIGILAGLSVFNGIEANGQDLPPGVENVTRMQSTGILESSHKPSEITSEIASPQSPKK